MRVDGWVMALVLLQAGCGPWCADQSIPGALIPGGSSSGVTAKGNGVLYSMIGAKRVSDTVLEEVALFHALVLGPEVERRGSGSALTLHCLSAVETLTWQLGNWQHGPFDLPDEKLELRYDGRTDTVTVGTQSYSAAQSNCFIVRLDSRWQPKMTQVPLLIREQVAATAIMARIRAAAPDDLEVRGLLLYQEVERSK